MWAAARIEEIISAGLEIATGQDQIKEIDLGSDQVIPFSIHINPLPQWRTAEGGRL